MQSLRDKLVQAGVISQEEAKAAQARAESEKQARAARRVQPENRPAPVETEKDRERRRSRELAERQKQVRALCDAQEVNERGEQAFFFRTRRRELRRLYLQPGQVEALEKGELAIVDRPNGQDRPHALVPRAAAEAIFALEDRAIRFWARGPGQGIGYDDEGPAEPAAS